MFWEGPGVVCAVSIRKIWMIGRCYISVLNVYLYELFVFNIIVLVNLEIKMPNNISKIQKDMKESIEATLDIKVIKKLNCHMYVVGDETGNTLLETSQDLKEEMVYKILKPTLKNDTLYAHPNFKLLKTNLSFKTKPLAKHDFQKYQEQLSQHEKATTEKKVDMKNFTKCEAFAENKDIGVVTLLIVMKSKNIDGKFGQYNIVTAKDCDGGKNSINIYNDKNGIVQADKLLTFTNLKKTGFKPDGAEFHRLATNYQTRIFEATIEEKEKFKNVFLGDEKTDIRVLGYENLICYESCKKCATKLIELFCKKCQKNVEDEKATDFYVTLYVQDVQNEDNIMNMFAFKKDLNIDMIKEDDIEKRLEDLVGKTNTIEYDKPENDGGRYKLVKLHKI